MDKKHIDQNVTISALFNMSHTLFNLLQDKLGELDKLLAEAGIEGYFTFKSDEEGESFLFLIAFIGVKEYEVSFHSKEDLIRFFLQPSIKHKEDNIRARHM